MNFNLITEEMISAACELDDLDEMIATVRQASGIKAVDAAVAVFTGYEHLWADKANRRQEIEVWLRAEAFYGEV